MSVSDLENPNPKPGDELRDQAARLLSFKYGQPKTEKRALGKKVDVFFEYKEYGKIRRIYVEAKDHSENLNRSDTVHIYSDYLGILEKNRPAELMIVTRNGLTTDARSYIEDERFDVFHQSIWELENSVLGLTDYARYLSNKFDEDNLREYYIDARANSVLYRGSRDETRTISDDSTDIFQRILHWIPQQNEKPIAILGGYGAGKSSLSKRLCAHLASEFLEDSSKRIPILVKLGQFSRFSSIESILAGMFGTEFPVPGFNVPLFLDCVERGRFVIICDGFDEMKHAMSWSDFRSTIAEINKLNKGSSSLILLGRPNAFMSLDEHIQVLRGKRKFGDAYRKLAEWPEFEEWELCDFSAAERSDFIRKYLHVSVKHSSLSDMSEDEINARVKKVDELATSEPAIFSKPVHAQILTELGSESSFDIDKFKNGISRWDLYEAFFAYLAERESQKPARRAVSDNSRLEFLREISYWLWTKRDGSTSFSSVEIPTYIIESLDLDDSDDPDIRLREYLTGAFLEKKDADVFFFGHRSFAEFLVADRLLRNNPAERDHTNYAKIIDGSVRDFFEEGLKDAGLDTWASTFEGTTGNIDISYINFLSHHCGGFRNLYNRLPRGNCKTLLSCFDDKFRYGPVPEKKLINLLSGSSASLFFLALRFIDISMSNREIEPNRIDKFTLENFGNALANRETFSRNTYKVDTIKKTIQVDGKRLRALVSSELERMGINICNGDFGLEIFGWPDLFTVDRNENRSPKIFGLKLR